MQELACQILMDSDASAQHRLPGTTAKKVSLLEDMFMPHTCNTETVVLTIK